MALLARCWTLLLFLVLFLLLFFIVNNYSPDVCSVLKLSSLAHFLISCHARPCLFVHSIHIAVTSVHMYEYSKLCNLQFITYAGKSLLDPFTTLYRVTFSFVMTVCLSVHLSVCLPDCMSVCPSVRPSVCMSVCLSVCMKHLGSCWKVFYWI
jgi:hypothetical protein